MTATAHTLATVIHHKHGVDAEFAAEAVETYITQIEDLDGREIDRDEITDDDADFITAAFASAQRAGDFGTREVDDVADAAEAAAAAKTALEDAEYTRNQAVKRALAHGARVVDVTAAAGVTRARIDQIRKGTR